MKGSFREPTAEPMISLLATSLILCLQPGASWDDEVIIDVRRASGAAAPLSASTRSGGKIGSSPIYVGSVSQLGKVKGLPADIARSVREFESAQKEERWDECAWIMEKISARIPPDDGILVRPVDKTWSQMIVRREAAWTIELGKFHVRALQFSRAGDLFASARALARKAQDEDGDDQAALLMARAAALEGRFAAAIQIAASVPHSTIDCLEYHREIGLSGEFWAMLAGKESKRGLAPLQALASGQTTGSRRFVPGTSAAVRRRSSTEASRWAQLFLAEANRRSGREEAARRGFQRLAHGSDHDEPAILSRSHLRERLAHGTNLSRPFTDTLPTRGGS